MMARMSGRLLFACVALLLAACRANEPSLYPFDPPPNIEPGQELLVVPADLIPVLADGQTIQLRESALDQVADGRRVLTGPGIVQAIRAHRILTGMAVEEVIWAIGGPPTRVRDQGPPGGHTLEWEVAAFQRNQRFWVRFDENGRATAAGTQ